MILAQYTQNDECGMTFAQADQAVSHIGLNFKIVNEYIDPKNFDNPIQTVVTDQYYTIVRFNSYTLNEIYIRK